MQATCKGAEMKAIWQDWSMGSKGKIVSDKTETYVVAQKMKGFL